MRFLILVMLTAGCFAAGNRTATRLSAAEIRELFSQLPTRPPTNREVLTADHFAVKVARVSHRNGPVEIHKGQDRVFYVLSGSAILRTGGTPVAPREIAPGEFQAAEAHGYRNLAMTPGAVLSVPRNVPYQIVASASQVEFLVVRVF